MEIQESFSSRFWHRIMKIIGANPRTHSKLPQDEILLDHDDEDPEVNMIGRDNPMDFAELPKRSSSSHRFASGIILHLCLISIYSVAFFFLMDPYKTPTDARFEIVHCESLQITILSCRLRFQTHGLVENSTCQLCRQTRAFSLQRKSSHPKCLHRPTIAAN
jgi:hypothetical protein